MRKAFYVTCCIVVTLTFACTGGNGGSEWASTRTVAGCTWRLPTVDDFKYMFQGCGGTAYTASIENNQPIDTGNIGMMLYFAGGTMLQWSNTWTSNECDGNMAWTFFNSNPTCFQQQFKNGENIVRACLAF